MTKDFYMSLSEQVIACAWTQLKSRQSLLTSRGCHTKDRWISGQPHWLCLLWGLITLLLFGGALLAARELLRVPGAKASLACGDAAAQLGQATKQMTWGLASVGLAMGNKAAGDLGLRWLGSNREGVNSRALSAASLQAPARACMHGSVRCAACLLVATQSKFASWQAGPSAAWLERVRAGPTSRAQGFWQWVQSEGSFMLESTGKLWRRWQRLAISTWDARCSHTIRGCMTTVQRVLQQCRQSFLPGLQLHFGNISKTVAEATYSRVGKRMLASALEVCDALYTIWCSSADG